MGFSSRVVLVVIVVAVGLFVVSAETAWADPITVTFEGTYSAVGIPGSGGPFVLTITVDNGGIGLVSQTWADADFVTATLVSGTYNPVYTQSTGMVISTDAAGELEFASAGGYFYNPATVPTSAQQFTYTFGLGAANVADAASSNAMRFPSDLTGWSISGGTAPVPEPSTLALLGLGLLGVAFTRRRRHAKAS